MGSRLSLCKGGSFCDEGALSAQFRRQGGHGAVCGDPGEVSLRRRAGAALFRLQRGRPAGGAAGGHGGALPPGGDAQPVRQAGRQGAGRPVQGVGYRPDPLPLPAGALHRPAVQEIQPKNPGGVHQPFRPGQRLRHPAVQPDDGQAAGSDDRRVQQGEGAAHRQRLERRPDPGDLQCGGSGRLGRRPGGLHPPGRAGPGRWAGLSCCAPPGLPRTRATST